MMPKGTICVMRRVNGQWIPLPLVNQQSYAEWTGCFSVISC